MTSKNKYIPMNRAFMDKTTDWVLTSLDISYPEITKRGIVLWCDEHLEGRWTMLGGSKFGFEDGTDAMMFQIQFGFK